MPCTHPGGNEMDHMTLWSHSVSLPAEPTSVARARDFVCAHLVTHSLRYLVNDVRLVTSELATNAIEHAKTPFDVSLERSGHSVRLTVRDGSPSPPELVIASSTALAGRGMLIVQQLSREWGVDTTSTGAKSVWACFATGRTMDPIW